MASLDTEPSKMMSAHSIYSISQVGSSGAGRQLSDRDIFGTAHLNA